MASATKVVARTIDQDERRQAKNSVSRRRRSLDTPPHLLPGVCTVVLAMSTTLNLTHALQVTDLVIALEREGLQSPDKVEPPSPTRSNATPNLELAGLGLKCSSQPHSTPTTTASHGRVPVQVGLVLALE